AERLEEILRRDGFGGQHIPRPAEGTERSRLANPLWPFKNDHRIKLTAWSQDACHETQEEIRADGSNVITGLIGGWRDTPVIFKSMRDARFLVPDQCGEPITDRMAHALMGDHPHGRGRMGFSNGDHATGLLKIDGERRVILIAPFARLTVRDEHTVEEFVIIQP